MRKTFKMNSAELLKHVNSGIMVARDSMATAVKAYNEGDGDTAVSMAEKAHDLMDDMRAWYEIHMVTGGEYSDIRGKVESLLCDIDSIRGEAADLINKVFAATVNQGAVESAPAGAADDEMDIFSGDDVPAEQGMSNMLDSILKRREAVANGTATGKAAYKCMTTWTARTIGDMLTEDTAATVTPDTADDMMALVSLMMGMTDALQTDIESLLGEVENMGAGAAVPDMIALPIGIDGYNVNLIASRYPDAVKANESVFTVSWSKLIQGIKKAEDVRNGKAAKRAEKAQAKREHFEERKAAGEFPFLGETLKGRTCTVTADSDSMKLVIRFAKRPSRKALDICKAANYRYDAGEQVWVRSLKVKAWREAIDMMAALDATA